MVKFNELTTRIHARYLSHLQTADNFDDEFFVRAIGFVMAARDSGIVEDLPEQFAEGDLFELPPAHTTDLINLGVEIANHISEKIAGPSMGES